MPVLALALLATACGDDGGTTVGAGGQTRPTGAGEVVVQVLIEGGFVPVESAVTAVPTVTVLGDGTVITTAPVTAIYPGPAITPLQSVKVSPDVVDSLLDRARELGLLGEAPDYGRPSVADAPDTTVTIAAGGRTYKHAAYALGIFDEPANRGRGLGGLSDEAVEKRRALSSFVEAASAVPPGEQPWRPSSVAVYDLGPYQAEPQLPQRATDWPLARPPAVRSEMFACTLVDGADAEVLLGALQRANSRTPWVVGGAQRSLAFRPIVPGQPGCPA